MRISDWSSDVCSDLQARSLTAIAKTAAQRCVSRGWRSREFLQEGLAIRRCRRSAYASRCTPGQPQAAPGRGGPTLPVFPQVVQALRSEEHTSELQSLMRISYAVFCLKKKNNEQLNINTHAEE